MASATATNASQLDLNVISASDLAALMSAPSVFGSQQYGDYTYFPGQSLIQSNTGEQYNTQGQLVAANVGSGSYDFNPSTGAVTSYQAPQSSGGFFSGLVSGVGDLLSNPMLDAAAIGAITGGLGDVALAGTGLGTDAAFTGAGAALTPAAAIAPLTAETVGTAATPGLSADFLAPVDAAISAATPAAALAASASAPLAATTAPVVDTTAAATTPALSSLTTTPSIGTDPLDALGSGTYVDPATASALGDTSLTIPAAAAGGSAIPILDSSGMIVDQTAAAAATGAALSDASASSAVSQLGQLNSGIDPTTGQALTNGVANTLGSAAANSLLGSVAGAATTAALAPSSTAAAAAANPFASQYAQYQQALQQLMTTGTSTIGAAPDYAFKFQQGENALQASAAAQGMLQSGNTLAALSNYGQNTAQSAYQQQVTNLMQLSGANAQNTGAAAQATIAANAGQTAGAASIGNSVSNLVNSTLNASPTTTSSTSLMDNPSFYSAASGY